MKKSNNSSYVILIFEIWNSEISVVLDSIVPNFDRRPCLHMKALFKHK